MATEHPPEIPRQETGTATLSSPMLWFGRGIRFLIILLVLAGSIWLAYYWMTHRPTAKRRPPQKEATLVEVTPIRLEDTRIHVRAMGEVVPAKIIQLPVRVSGQIVHTDPQFLPGGMFAAGQEILRLEQEDYQIALRQRQADYTKAESSRKLEMGQQSVAKSEYELLGETVGKGDESLLLRKPQLESIQATCQAAKAAVDKAELDLARTIVSAPFNAMIATQNVDLGSYVGPGNSLATLVGTDQYWIEVSVPVDELRRLKIPGYNSDTASQVKIYHEPAWGTGIYRVGTVARLLTELESKDRTARLLVVVEDPLHLQSEAERHPLILNAFVRVEIEGDTLTDVVTIPRTALRDGNHVWLMSSEKTLEIRPVAIAWSANDHVYIANSLADDDQLIISDLAAPVSGMLLRLNGDSEHTASDNPAGQGTEAEARPQGPGAGQGQGQGRGQGAGRGQGGQS